MRTARFVPFHNLKKSSGENGYCPLKPYKSKESTQFSAVGLTQSICAAVSVWVIFPGTVEKVGQFV
jgi:hypothetical protein